MGEAKGPYVARLLPADSDFGKALTIKKNVLNTPDEAIIENIKTNIRRGLPQIPVCQAQPEREIAILAGGPSLNEHEEEIRAFDGWRIATNGSLKWAEERDIKIHMAVLVDAREWNRRFVDPPVEGVVYALASQVHPSVFDLLADQRVWLWHGGTAKLCLEELDEVYGDGNYRVVKVGSTVLLGTMWVMYLLGLRNMHLYGADSCITANGVHHAYNQPENDDPPVLWIRIAGRDFYCHTAHLAQLQDFLGFSKYVAEDLNVCVHGDGLIAYALEVLAETGELKLEGIDDGN